MNTTRLTSQCSSPGLALLAPAADRERSAAAEAASADSRRSATEAMTATLGLW